MTEVLGQISKIISILSAIVSIVLVLRGDWTKATWFMAFAIWGWI